MITKTICSRSRILNDLDIASTNYFMFLFLDSLFFTRQHDLL